MLQQTTVAAVIPFFQRFLESFPTVKSLADSPHELVLKHWEGLGYYRRARHLHAAAKIIASDYGGSFPRDPLEAAKLPGVGRYIKGAVLSQAYEARLPIVEANSLRVLARLFGYRGDPRSGEGQRWTWLAAEKLLPRKRIGDFNQAIMELGATVCTPRQPRCGVCPLKKECIANRDGLQELIPPPKQSQAIKIVSEVALVIRRGDEVLLGKRRDDAKRWANLWEFPHGEVNENESLMDAAKRIAKEHLGIRIALNEELIAIKHTVTNHAITMTAFAATTKAVRLSSYFYAELRWCLPQELSTLPTSSPQRKIMAHFLRATGFTPEGVCGDKLPRV